MAEVLAFLDRFGPALVAGYAAVSFILTALGNYTLQAISDKTEAAPSWVAWVPIVQIYAFVRAVGTSFKVLLGWVAAGIGIAIVGAATSQGGNGPAGLLAVVYTVSMLVWFGGLMWRLAERRHLSGWVGLACFIPILGLFFYAYIAFHDGVVRPSGVGLVLTAALALLAAANLSGQLRDMSGFLRGDPAQLEEVPPEHRAEFAELLAQLREGSAAGEAGGPEHGAEEASGLLARLLSWNAPAPPTAEYPEAIEIPQVAECEAGTRAVGAAPPLGSEMWCERVGTGQKHGWYLRWHANGQLSEAGRYANDLRQGVWTRFWASGGQRARVHFEADREHGILVLWNELGTKEREIRWHHGEPATP